MFARIVATLIVAAPVLYLLSRLRSDPLSLKMRLWLLVRNLTTEFGALTLAAADAVLKDDYQSPLREQLNNAHFLLPQLEKNTEDVTGRRGVLALHVGRNSGVGARGDNGTLPTAGNQQYDNVYVPMRYNYVRFEITGPTIRSMRNDTGSFIRGLKSERDGALVDGKRNVARQVWGESNGRIATCGVTSASTTVVLASTTRQDQMRHLKKGTVIDIGTVADPVSVASARTITSIDTAAKTIVISGAAVTTAATDFIFASGAGGATNDSGLPGDGQIEMTGLQTIISATATLHTLAVATEPEWKSGVNSNGGTNRNISENLVIGEIMDAEIESGSVIDLVVGSAGVLRSWGSELMSLKRFTDTVQLKGGYTGVSVSSVQMGRSGGTTTAFLWDRYAPDNRLWGITSKDLVLFEQTDWEWMDQDGAVLSRVANKDAYEAVLLCDKELAASRRNSHFLISDITES